MEKYGKALTAVVFAALTAAYQISQAGSGFGRTEVVQVAIAATLAASVWLVPVTRSAPWVKSALAGLLAALQILVTVANWNTSSAWLQVALAVLTALGVGIAPATSSPGSDDGEPVTVGLGADTVL